MGQSLKTLEIPVIYNKAQRKTMEIGQIPWKISASKYKFLIDFDNSLGKTLARIVKFDLLIDNIKF